MCTQCTHSVQYLSIVVIIHNMVITDYLFPHADLTLTIDRLTKLFQSVENPDRVGRHRRSIGELLGLPQSALEEIKKSYQSMAKRKEAYLDAYTHHHPCPSWKVISEVLWKYELYQQAEEVESTYVQGMHIHF